MTKTFVLAIRRGTPGNQYWEEFELQRRPSLNLISALMEIQKHPKNKKGEKVSPPVWEQGCLEEVCGSCSMLVNGRPRQSCTALVEDIIKETESTTITIAPMTKFPLIRDLVVNRDRMIEPLKKIEAWIETDGSKKSGTGPKISQDLQETMYTLSTCMSCGCCTEACPQINEKSAFIGPAIISQARLFNASPLGKGQKKSRLRTLMEEGGIADCGNAQNCVQVCPKQIPLTESIAVAGREVGKQAFKDIFSSNDLDESI